METVGIDPRSYKHIYVYGTPRGATNLFCALLHNHTNIVAINHRSTRKYLNHLIETKRSAERSHWLFNIKDLIYEKGGPAKDFTCISYILFDKVHWASDRAFQHVELTLSRVRSGLADGIVLIRHPLQVLKSMDNFHRRYGRPRWALTRFNVLRYLVQYFLPQLWLLKIKGIYGIVVEAFVKNLPYSYRDLCEKLGIPFELRFADFRLTFEDALTWTGGKFVIRKSEVVGGGSFLTSKSIKAPAQDVYFDPISGEPTWGYGQFNPALPLNPERLMRSNENFDLPTSSLIREVFCKGISKKDVDYLFETRLLDVERLREFDMKGIGNIMFHLLNRFPPPKWLQWSWKYLRSRPY